MPLFKLRFLKYLPTHLVCLIIFFFNSDVSGQLVINAKPPIVIPASPNASELGKYGNLDIGLQTGSLNYKIPIFTLEGSNWKLPLDLQYSTTGITVDQLASRVGMGWAFNAGGVVTRTVNGRPDEIATRSTLPANWQSFDQSILDYLNNVTNTPNYDLEPDEFFFNFNGYSGKFILDENNNPVLIPHNNLQIQYNVINSQQSTITIITPDGTKYFFNDIELTSVSSICFSGTSSPVAAVPTSWYLSKVILPNKDEVNLSYSNFHSIYKAGISQTLTKTYPFNEFACEQVKCPEIDDSQICVTEISCYGKILTTLTFKNTVINFNYIDRLDLAVPDDPSIKTDQLLSSIQVFNNGEIQKEYSFLYEYGYADSYFASQYGQTQDLRYRPFLKKFIEKGNDAVSQKQHTFFYNGISQLPPRLSFSQDYLGHFNGKLNANFIGRLSSTSDDAMFDRANADRSPDLESSRKGVLTKIEYPTKAQDSIEYSLNEVRFTQDAEAPKATVSLTIPFSSNSSVISSSAVFTPYSAYNITISAGTLISMTEGSPPDNSTVLMLTEVVRNSDGATIFSQNIFAQQGLDSLPLNNLQAGVDYFLRITTYQANLKGTASITFESGAPSTLTVNKLTAGLRVSKLLTLENNSLLGVKKIFYAHLDSLSISSGQSSSLPVYSKESPTSITGSCQVDDFVGPVSYLICRNRTAHSSSVTSLQQFSQNHIYYKYVVESTGENFEGGGVMHEYIIEPDGLSIPLWGQTLLGLKTSNTGYQNGLEKELTIFKKIEGSFLTTRKIISSYKIDPLVNKSINAYLISQNYVFPVHYSPPHVEEFNGFEINRYTINSRWVHLDSTVVYNYNDTGDSPVKNKTVYVYSNPSHMQVTQSTIYGSDNSSNTINSLYPDEMISQGKDTNGIYSGMKAMNYITPIIEETLYKNGIKINFGRTNYYMPHSSIYMPESVQLQSSESSPLETRIQFHGYDSQGNVLSVSKASGPNVCYVYSYGGQYPIAKIENAEYSGVVSVLGQANIDYYQNLSNPTDAQVNSFINPLRAALPQAQVTTYTYQPLVGMTGMTDPRGQTTTYEYDNFQRLWVVRDHNGKILKKTDYHYKP